MILSDRDIRDYLDRGTLVVRPLQERAMQPASVDLHLDDQIGHPHWVSYIDPRKRQEVALRDVSLNGYMLQPGEFVLGQTLEWIEIPSILAARIEGKSSLGRLGLTVHSTAGYVDPGFQGRLTLEIVNGASVPILLLPEMPIAQLSFMQLCTASARVYGDPSLGSRYLGQEVPTGCQGITV